MSTIKNQSILTPNSNPLLSQQTPAQNRKDHVDIISVFAIGCELEYQVELAR